MIRYLSYDKRGQALCCFAFNGNILRCRLDGTMISYKRCLVKAFLATLAVLFYCEYLIYYIVLFQCGWPKLDDLHVDSSIPLSNEQQIPVHAMFLSDTHLLGSRNGHWLDKLKREWQMYRAFQTAMTIHKPDVVFVLGDIFDEGFWSYPDEFASYVKRFHSMFYVPKGTRLYVVAGNHDMNFHYRITPYLNRRFVQQMKAPSVKRVSIRGNHFVLLNSMAMEGDGCFLCKPTEVALNKISKLLKCAKGVDVDCATSSAIDQYSRPILLQHYPMYRESDEACNEPDEAPENIKVEKFRERWECLSREASSQLLDILEPRLIVDGHTHHGCRRYHRDNILEFTVPSFSWRNKNNPSFLLGIFTPNNYAAAKCYMPEESTVIQIYIISVIGILIYLLTKFKRRNRHSYFKF